MYLFFRKRRLERNTATKKQCIKEKINLHICMYTYVYIEEKIQNDRNNEVKDNGSNGNNEIRDNRRIEDKTQRAF